VRALVLAAGEGTRLRPLTLDCPKPMLPVGGRPILEHLIALLRSHGVTEIAINLHYQPNAIVRHFGDGSRFGVSIIYSREERLLGSAGAAKQLEWFFDDSFLLLYGDVLTDLDLSALSEQHRIRRAAATLALHEVPDPTRCGIVGLGPDGRIVRFVEKPSPDAVFSNLTAAGVCVLEPGILRHIPLDRPFDLGYDLFPLLLGRGLPVYGYLARGYVLDVGSPERYAQAEADLQAGLYRPRSDLAGARSHPLGPE
jgi:mannose-1-phosphate guanylyltransferase / phosphomannomutase